MRIEPDGKDRMRRLKREVVGLLLDPEDLGDRRAIFEFDLHRHFQSIERQGLLD